MKNLEASIGESTRRRDPQQGAALPRASNPPAHEVRDETEPFGLRPAPTASPEPTHSENPSLERVCHSNRVSQDTKVILNAVEKPSCTDNQLEDRLSSTDSNNGPIKPALGKKRKREVLNNSAEEEGDDDQFTQPPTASNTSSGSTAEWSSQSSKSKSGGWETEARKKLYEAQICAWAAIEETYRLRAKLLRQEIQAIMGRNRYSIQECMRVLKEEFGKLPVEMEVKAVKMFMRGAEIREAWIEYPPEARRWLVLNDFTPLE